IDHYSERDRITGDLSLGNRKIKIAHGYFSSDFFSVLLEAEDQIQSVAIEVDVVIPLAGDGSGRGEGVVGRFLYSPGFPIQRAVLATVVGLEFALQFVAGHFGGDLDVDLFAVALTGEF